MIHLEQHDPRYQRVVAMLQADQRAELGGGGPQTCDGYELGAVRDARAPGSPIVPGIAHRGDLTTIYGSSGSGKSALVAALARSVLDGGDLVGRRATRGRVLYIAPELGASVLRAAAAAIYDGATPEQVAHYRRTLAMTTEAPPMRPMAEWGPRQQWSPLDEWLSGVGERDLVVIDTWGDALGAAGLGETADCKTALAAMRRVLVWTGGAVVVVHHPPRRTQRGEAPAERGGSELRSASSVMLPVERVARHPDGITMRLRFASPMARRRDGGPEPDVDVRLAAAGDGEPLRLASWAPVATPKASVAARLTATQRRVLAAVAAGSTTAAGIGADAGVTPKVCKMALAALVAADRITPARAGRTVTYAIAKEAK